MADEEYQIRNKHMLLVAAGPSREAARALRIRAMLRLGEGNLEAAWEDLLAIHRLARLHGQGWTVIDVLLALSMDGVACDGDARMLGSGKLSAAAALRMREQLRAIPAEPRMIDRMDVGERMMYCDAVCFFARTGPLDVLTALAANTENVGLLARVREDAVQEVVIATPLSVEGEATALYVAQALRGAGSSPKSCSPPPMRRDMCCAYRMAAPG